MKILYLSIITALGIGGGIYLIFSHVNLYPLNIPNGASGSYTSFDAVGLQNTYHVGDAANFTLVISGHGMIPCMAPEMRIYNDLTPDKSIFDVKSAILSCPVPTQPQDFQFYFPSKTSPFIITLNQTGNYTLEISHGGRTILDSFTVVSPEYHDFPDGGQYSIVNATFGIPVENDTMAANMVGFNAPSPTYLPLGYQIKLIKVAKDLPLVTIFASKYPLTNKTTSEEFFYNDTGILITYSTANDLQIKNFKMIWSSAPASQKMTIDGFQAIFENIRKGDHDGYLYDQWADLALFKGNIIIGVRGFLSHSDLVKITTSMLENQK